MARGKKAKKEELHEPLEASVEVQAEPLEAAVQVDTEPVVPEAQLVFTWTVGKRWLEWAHHRAQGAFESIRFEPRSIPENQIYFLILLAGNALAKEYIYQDEKKLTREVRKGLFYVPVELVNLEHSAFARLQEVERDERWVTFCRK